MLAPPNWVSSHALQATRIGIAWKNIPYMGGTYPRENLCMKIQGEKI
jgi:hypothetical protein